MASEQKTVITVETTVNAPIEKVWKLWTTPEDVMQWNAASPDWHSPKATNDLKVGGEFHYYMEAKDGSFGFDFWGTYSEIEEHQKIANTLGDGRKMVVTFHPKGNSTHIIEEFEAEDQNSIELQRTGWQAILNNFKKHAELK